MGAGLRPFLAGFMYALVMGKTANNRYLGLYVLMTSVAVSLLVTPFNSIDPVSLPKLCILIVLSFIAAGFVFSDVEFFRNRKNRSVIVIVGLFLVQLFLVLFIDSRDFAYKFYGTFGRNTGFAAYLSLIFLLMASTVSATRLLLRRYVITILSFGSFLAIYGILQSKGIDFYQFENVYGTNVFGTFGNPNFHSAFMGIAAAASLTVVLYSRIRLSYKAGLMVLVLISIYNISLSSQQGYLNLGLGVASATVIYLLKSRKPILGWLSVGLTIFGVFLISLGILNVGPLAELIYKSSLQARGFYWRAASRMILEHPFFGVGMDGFGDHYLRSRTSEIAQVNVSITSDSAHNIPLDIGSSGGVPLLFAYLAIIVLVFISIARILKRNLEFDVVFTAVIAAWVAYQAQSLISINQLGLGVWGWSLSGLIIGYELNTRTEETVLHDKPKGRNRLANEKISPLAVLLVFITTIIGIGIALPPAIAADKFYNALQSGNPKIIESAAYLKPNDRKRYLYVAQALQENKFEPEAIKVLRDAAKIYPDSIDLWRRWVGIPSATPTDVARAKAEIKRLDPYAPDL